MTETPKKRRGRPAKKKKEEAQEAPAFLEEPKKEYKGTPIEAIKTPCPHCGISKLVAARSYPPLKVCHRVQGKTFNTLVKQQRKCSACNRNSIVFNYEVR
jgi:hypothetical protein